MKTLLKKMVTSYAKATTNTCFFLLFHATKMPKSLIKE
ncbi:MAG: cyclic lactone autoinducer peptide [Clostridia bacterium]|nr:cyclic lactone autoinducer peptide [Clostridia bacterium]MDD4375692.1 cyclic lactone autoinducer peptide [Clostridia bacterium]